MWGCLPEMLNNVNVLGEGVGIQIGILVTVLDFNLNFYVPNCILRVGDFWPQSTFFLNVFLLEYWLPTFTVEIYKKACIIKGFWFWSAVFLTEPFHQIQTI